MVRRFLCNRNEVPFDALREISLEGDEKVCVINAGGMFFACQPTCPHEGVRLCEGCVEGTTLTCLEHLWQWDLRDGSPVGLAEKRLGIRKLELDGDGVYLVG
jgi:toluene monooxygenase system ferredoxin subunit